jgi:hypothetical protein
MNRTDTDDQYPPEEAQRRADEALKRMLSTPPKPHKEMKKDGKTKATKSREGSRKA